MLARRWVRASRPLRRRLTPIVFGGVTLVVSTGNLIVAKFSDGPPNQTLQNLVLAALVGVPIGVLVDILRARLARLAVGDLVLELSRDRDPRTCATRSPARSATRRSQLAYWLPEFDGLRRRRRAAVELPERPARASRLVDRDRRPVAALVHDPSLREEPALLDAVGAAAGIALENERLQAELRARRGAARRRARGSSSRRPSAGGSSATCTTARSSGWSRSRSSSACSSRGSATTPTRGALLEQARGELDALARGAARARARHPPGGPDRPRARRSRSRALAARAPVPVALRRRRSPSGCRRRSRSPRTSSSSEA